MIKKLVAIHAKPLTGPSKDPGGIIYVPLQSPHNGQAAIRIGPSNMYSITLVCDGKTTESKTAWDKLAASLHSLTKSSLQPQ